MSGATNLLVVAGGAGSGKSVALARAIQVARAHGWPTLALRIDRFLAASRIEDVGAALLDRPESPVGLLGNRHGLKETLLVVDQVDAVSEASGRSGRMRDQLFQMIADSGFYPKMKVVIACRSYDLEHDSRLKQFISSPYAQTVTLKPLDWEAGVRPVLRPLGLADRTFTDREQRLLSVPINLRVFVDLYRLGEVVEGEISGSRLFDQLIEVRAREFRDAGLQWTPQEALGAIAQSMSDHQELTAPVSVLSPYAGARDALSSASLITAAGGQIQFAHESFFDHVFSVHFIASGRTVRELLLSDEQRLFRRTQVRQIFARLRDETSNRRYLANLQEVGDRATAWLLPLMDDEDPQVRREAAHTSWDAILDGPTDRSALVLEHIQSRSFADESDWLMRSLEERIDRYPDVAFAAAMRVVELMDGWKGGERQGHWMTLHHLGRMLVRLYRAVDGDSRREAELLDLFDIYLAREPGDMRTQISAYERH